MSTGGVVNFLGPRTGFPQGIPVLTQDLPAYGAGTKYPVSYTFDELVELFWRRRFIKVTFGFTGGVQTSGGPITPSTSADFVLTTNCEADFPITVLDFRDLIGREIGLVQTATISSYLHVQRQTSVGSHAFTTDNFTDPNAGIDGPEASFTYVPTPTSDDYVDELGIGISMFRLGILNPAENTYYPSIEFWFSAGGFASNPDDARAFHESSFVASWKNTIDPSDPDHVWVDVDTPACTFDFCGKSIQLYQNGLYGPGGGLYATAATPTANGFWGYNGLWDTDTGARI